MQPLPKVREIQDHIGGSTRTISLAIKQFMFDRDREQSKNVSAEKALFDKQANQLMTTLWPFIERFVVLAKNNQRGLDETQISALRQTISEVADAAEKAQKEQAIAEEKLAMARQETKQAIDEKCRALIDLNRNEGAMRPIQEQLKAAQDEIRELDRELERLRAQNTSLSDSRDRLEQKLLTVLTGGNLKNEKNEDQGLDEINTPAHSDLQKELGVKCIEK